MLKKIEQLWDKLKLDNKKIALILIVFFVFVYIDLAYILNGQLKGLGSLSRKAAQLKKDLDVFNKDFLLMQQIKLVPGQPIEASKEQRLISEGEIPVLLEEIYALANKNTVKIMEAKPAKDTRGKDTKAASLGSVSPLLLTLNLFSGYHNLGSFLSDLENATVYLAVEELKVQVSHEDYFQQKVNLVLRTYIKK